MPDDPMQAQSPDQVLSGQTSPPVQSGPAQPPPQAGQAPSSSAPQLQHQPPAPTAQQAMAARHHALGQVTSFLFSNQRDENGEPIKQPPGQIFRSLLAGASLGATMGSEGKAQGGSVSRFLNGVSRGGNAVEQQNHARQQEAQKQAQDRAKLMLEQQRTG
jgi:hypothetical protein